MVHSFLLLVYSVSLQTVAQAIAAESSPSACQVGKENTCISQNQGHPQADLEIDDPSLLQRKREGIGEVGEDVKGKEESFLQTMDTEKEDVQKGATRNTVIEAKKRLLHLLQRLPKGAQKKAWQIIKNSKWYQRRHNQKRASSVLEKADMKDTESSKKIKRLVNMLQQRLPTNSAVKEELERIKEMKGPRRSQLKKLQRVMKMKRLLNLLQRLPSSVVMRALKKVKEAKQLRTEQDIDDDDDASFLQRRERAPMEGDKKSLQQESIQTGSMPKTTKETAKRLLEMLQRLPKGPARKRAAKLIKESKWFQKQMQKAGMSQKKVQTDAMPKTTKETAKRLLDLLQRLPKGPARKRAAKLIKESKWFQKQMQKAGMLQAKKEAEEDHVQKKEEKIRRLLKMFQTMPAGTVKKAIKEMIKNKRLGRAGVKKLQELLKARMLQTGEPQ